ncbi:MAG TPA: DUF4157 domain-containing protein, partial [Nostocaceae cyanobacterium]|nr:DUF4157 domain-containing protein [Nostocaceae cyanobacterium]
GGSLLSEQIRAYMEPRFGADFSSVRVHTGEQAVQMNRELGAQAFTHGSNIYYGAGKSPGVNELTAHELTHVVQQMDNLQRKCTNCEKEDERIMRKENNSLYSFSNINSQVGDDTQKIGDKGYRLTIAPIDLQSEPEYLEHEADKMTEQVMRSDHKLLHSPLSKNITKNQLSTPAIQRARVLLPRPIPLCGLNLTHIDLEPPRARDLEPCQPKNVRVTRVNLIGRQVTAATTGNGRIVFNLHIGYYRDPATGRLCAIVDDSKKCIAPRCKELGCFPTIQEVMQAIISFLIGALIVLGTIALTIIEAIIKELFGGSAPIPAPI